MGLGTIYTYNGFELILLGSLTKFTNHKGPYGRICAVELSPVAVCNGGLKYMVKINNDGVTSKFYVFFITEADMLFLEDNSRYRTGNKRNIKTVKDIKDAIVSWNLFRIHGDKSCDALKSDITSKYNEIISLLNKLPICEPKKTRTNRAASTRNTFGFIPNNRNSSVGLKSIRNRSLSMNKKVQRPDPNKHKIILSNAERLVVQSGTQLESIYGTEIYDKIVQSVRSPDPFNSSPLINLKGVPGRTPNLEVTPTVGKLEVTPILSKSYFSPLSPRDRKYSTIENNFNLSSLQMSLTPSIKDSDLIYERVSPEKDNIINSANKHINTPEKIENLLSINGDDMFGKSIIDKNNILNENENSKTQNFIKINSNICSSDFFSIARSRSDKKSDAIIKKNDNKKLKLKSSLIVEKSDYNDDWSNNPLNFKSSSSLIAR